MCIRDRVKGVYFAILTQALTVAFWLVFCMNNMKLCGTNGLTRFDKILGYSISSSNTKLALYLITLIILIVAYQSLTILINTRFGRLLIAINDDENNLRFYGYKPYVFKLFVFTISGIVAGLGGMLYVPQMGIITPEYMTAKWSIMIVIWVAIGGRGTLSGAILGALGVNLIYNYLTSNAPELWPLLQGSLFIIVVLLFPKGFSGLLDVIPLRNFNRNPVMQLRHMDLNFGNTCNLKCRMCFSDVSSAIAEELQDNPELAELVGDNPRDIKDWLDDPISFESVKKLIPHTHTLKLAGGEPLFMPGVLKLLRWMIESDNTNVFLDITTNGTRLQGKTYKLLEHFEKVIQFSMCGVGYTNDYIRSGADWNTLSEAYKKYRGRNLTEVEDTAMIARIREIQQGR